MQDKTKNQNFEGQLIDVEKVFHDKSPRIASKIPQFVYNYLKKIIHQDTLNEAISRFDDQIGLEFVNSILGFMGVNITYEGLENIPAEGRYIFASNHPLGGLDGLALMKVAGMVRKDRSEERRVGKESRS